MTNLEKLRACELFLFDVDGTLYLGDEVYDGAIALIINRFAKGRIDKVREVETVEPVQ